jgi:tetratricopeptide (TPR) repeat protein
MTEALITDLARIEALRVISRTSVMQYKGAKKPLPQIAKELGVDAVLEGSVLQVGGRVRITAQLIEAATDRHLWAESYERDLADVLDLQSEVARAIAREIRVELSPEERATLARARSVDPAAHEAYLKGRSWQFRFGEEGFRKALELYERAVSLDPTYALVWAAIAETYGNGADLFLPSVEAFSKARAAAERALRLDESLSEAHTSLGIVRAFFDWDWKGGEAEFLRAIDLNPNSAWGHDWYGWWLTTQGRLDEAINELERAVRLDPLAAPIHSDLALPFLLKGDHARAKKQIDRAFALDSGFFGARNFLVWMREREGDLDAAIAEAEKLRGLGVDTIAVGELGRLFGRAGRREDAERMLAELRAMSRTSYVSPFFHAIIHVGLGDKDRAFEWLERCEKERVVALSLFARVGPLLDPLRSDPRFAALLRRMNLAS